MLIDPSEPPRNNTSRFPPLGPSTDSSKELVTGVSGIFMLETNEKNVSEENKSHTYLKTETKGDYII